MKIYYKLDDNKDVFEFTTESDTFKIIEITKLAENFFNKSRWKRHYIFHFFSDKLCQESLGDYEIGKPDEGLYINDATKCYCDSGTVPEFLCFSCQDANARETFILENRVAYLTKMIETIYTQRDSVFPKVLRDEIENVIGHQDGEYKSMSSAIEELRSYATGNKHELLTKILYMILWSIEEKHPNRLIDLEALIDKFSEGKS